jgi:hypothetical protein
LASDFLVLQINRVGQTASLPHLRAILPKR